ncbi:MAG: GEVED domain-containing protein [Bacteroidota bacterium]
MKKVRTSIFKWNSVFANSKVAAFGLIAMLLSIYNATAQYCTPSGNFSACALTNDFWITAVSFSGTGSTFSYSGGNCVNNSPYYLNTGYQGDVVAGSTYNLSITKAGNTYKTYFNVWVDWDNNNVLSDATPFVENIAPNMLLTAGGGVTATASITIPAGVTAGVHRMRVRVQYNQTNANNPCLTTGQAETKDFNLNVMSGCIPPVVTANASNTAICEGDTVVFTGSGATTYLWSNGITDGISFFPTATGTYYVTGTDAGGCTDSASVTVAVTPLPVYTVSVSLDTVCSGISVIGVATGNSSTTYEWIPGGIVGDTVVLIPTLTTTYSCVGVDAGCITSHQIVVTVFTLPAVPTISQSGSLLTCNATGAVSFQWSLDGNEVSGATDNTFNAGQQTGNYMVEVTDSNGCHNQSASFNYTGDAVTVVSFSSFSIFPNPFSDFILLENIEVKTEIELLNVQGIMLMRKRAINNKEIINTSDIPSGVYLLKINSGKELINKVVIKY